MENLDSLFLNDQVDAMGIAVILITLGTHFLKNVFKTVDPRIFSIALSLICGLVYSLSVTYLSAETLKTLSSFAVMTFSIATAIYRLQKK